MLICGIITKKSREIYIMAKDKRRFDMDKKPKKANYLLYPIMVVASFVTLIFYRHKLKVSVWTE